jgi:hypothetical protein
LQKGFEEEQVVQQTAQAIAPNRVEKDSITKAVQAGRLLQLIILAIARAVAVSEVALVWDAA